MASAIMPGRGRWAAPEPAGSPLPNHLPMPARTHALSRQLPVAGRRGSLARAAERVLLVVCGYNPWPLAGPAGHLAALVMVVTALALVVSQLSTGGLGPPNARFVGNDLVAYLTGGALLARGDAAHLYDAARQLEVQRALVAGLGPPDWALNSYVNPPTWALLMAPLSSLGLLGADWLWRIAQLALAGGALLAGAAGAAGAVRSGARSAPRAALLALTFFPFVQGWHHRSMVSVLLLGFGGWMALAARGRPALAGAALSLLLLKPQYAVFPVVYLLWKRQWAQVGGFLLGASAQAALTVLVLVLGGGPLTLSALAPFIADGGGSGAYLQAQVSLRAALLNTLPAVPAIARAALLALLTGAVWAVLLRRLGRSWPDAPRRLGWEMLAVAAAAAVTAIHNHVTGLVLLLPPAVALLVPAGPTPRAAVQRPLALLALLLALPSVGLLLAGISAWLYVLAGWITTLGLLGLALHVLRPGAEPADEPPVSIADAADTRDAPATWRAPVPA